MQAASLVITTDNDGPFGTDHDYTHGFEIAYSDNLSGISPALFDYLPLSTFDSSLVTSSYMWRFSLGQKMWTPSDISSPVPVENERPYAGLLYAQADLISVDSDTAQSLGFMAGVTGPGSYADTVQMNVHKLIGSTRPQGWDYQIEESLILNLIYEGNQKLTQYPGPSVTSHELSVPVRLMAGNYRSEVAAGVIWRWGRNLEDSFASIKTENEISLRPHMIKGDSPGAFLFAGGEMRYRFNDITIEGDRPTELYPVDVEPVQGTAVLGLALYGQSVGASLSFAVKSRDFKQASDPYFANMSASVFFIF